VVLGGARQRGFGKGTAAWFWEGHGRVVLGRAQLVDVAEKSTNACSTVEERRFSAA
jgi:hypothetical protein